MRIGRHMPTHSKMVKAAEIAQQIGCETIQIFASNPTAWGIPAMNHANFEAFAQAAHAYHLDPVVIHAPYLIILGSPDDIIWKKSVALLSWTMQAGASLGATYIVFHTGSHRGSGVEAGLAHVAQGIAQVLQGGMPSGVMLLLENDVGAGNTLGGCFEQLAEILHLLPEYYDTLGMCLDTAHLWGAGYDISQAAMSAQVLQHFDEVIGMARLKVLHLNESKKSLGSHRDVHSRLGEGMIGEDGLCALLSDQRLDHVAVLMETPIQTDEHNKEDWNHDAGQIAKAKAWRDGQEHRQPGLHKGDQI